MAQLPARKRKQELHEDEDEVSFWILLLGGIAAVAVVIAAIVGLGVAVTGRRFRCYNCNRVVHEGNARCPHCNAALGWG